MAKLKASKGVTTLPPSEPAPKRQAKKTVTDAAAIDRMIAAESYRIFESLFSRWNVEGLAKGVNLGSTMLRKWAKPPNDRAGQNYFNPLDRILQISHHTGEVVLIEWLCEKVGGYLVKNGSPKRGDASLHQASARVTLRFARIIECVADAVSDENVSEEEAQKIRKDWEALKSQVEGFVQACERKEFATAAKVLSPSGRAPR